MIKSIQLLSFMLLISTKIFASYSTDWIRPADNYQINGSMIARDKVDNVIVTGAVQSNIIYTRKYDKFGNFQWEKTSLSGVAGVYEKSGWVNCDKNKNIYVTGYQYSGTSWEYPSAIVVIKYNTNGVLKWKKVIALSYIVGSSTGYAFNLKSEMDASGNLFIGTAGTSPNGFVLIKLNTLGTILFNNTINLTGTHQFNSLRLKGNKVLITGRASAYDVKVVAWDTLGTFLWSKSLAGQSGYDVELDGAGNVFILTSNTNLVSPTSGNDIVIYRLNGNGVQTAMKKYDFGGNDYPTRFTLVSGRISVIGYCTTTASAYFDWITFQINTAGTVLWNVKYNGTLYNDEQPYALTAKTNGEVFVTGKGGPLHTQVNGSSYLRMVTLKYSSTGVTQWVDSLNIYSGWGLACTLATDNSLFVMSGTKMTAFHFLDYTGTGSCGVPSGLNTTNVIDTSATFSWTPVAGAYLYHLRFKTFSAVEWTIVSTNLSSINIKTLSGGTAYYYAVEAICSNGPSGYSASATVTTTGVGYCVTGGQSTATEFLNYVWIGGIQNLTMSNNGYADFTNLSTNLTQGVTYYGYLSGSLPFGLTENYSIWIDYNNDFDFADAGEQVVNLSSDFLGYIAINFTVPVTAQLGTTRMRVTMEFAGTPTPCGLYARGETEDYSVVIVPPAKIENAFLDNQQGDFQYEIFPNPFSDKISVQSKSDNVPELISIYDVFGKLLLNFESTDLKNDFDLSSLSSGIYFCRIKSNENFQTFKLIKN